MTLAARPSTRRTRRTRLAPIRALPAAARGPGVLVLAEGIAATLGFAAVVVLARRLGPGGFAGYERAAAVAAWWLVLVRGGCDPIAYREAARRPRLVGPLTDTLLGLRLAGAGAGGAVVLLLAWLAGPGRGGAVAAAGLVLPISAMAADVGLRARGRWVGLAAGQVARSLGLVLAVLALVRPGPGGLVAAAGCLALGEGAATATVLALHRREQGWWPRPRFRGRAWRVLARRGAVAGMARFARVSLYAADLVALGGAAGPDMGSYALARRIGFALLALGLVVPATAAPALARGWAAGPDAARAAMEATLGRLIRAALPVGLVVAAFAALTPAMFGEEYRSTPLMLGLVTLRLPFVLAGNVQGVALVACRREGRAMGLNLGMLALGWAALPASAARFGPAGVGWAALGVEAAGVVAGRRELARLGIAPRGWRWVLGSGAGGGVR